MNIIESLLVALKSLFSNKLRSSLTMLGIIIGVGSVIALLSIGRGAQNSILSTYNQMGTNLLTIVPTSGETSGMMGFSLTTPTLTLKDSEAIERAYGVESVAPANESFVQISTNLEDKFCALEGITPEFMPLMNYNLSAGQFISQYHVNARSLVIVLGADTAEALFGERNPIGETVRLRGYRFNVIGTMEAVGGSMMGISMDNVVYVPITTYQTRLFPQKTSTGEDAVQSINVRVSETAYIEDTRQDIVNILRKEHRLSEDENNDFSVISQQQMVDMINQVMGVFNIFLGSIAGISLLVGGIE